MPECVLGNAICLAQTVSTAVCVGGVCGTVYVLVTQGSGPGLTPPSAPVKVVPRTQLLIKMPGAGTPLTLVLHVKSDKTQCLSVLSCKLFFFLTKWLLWLGKKNPTLDFLGFLFPKCVVTPNRVRNCLLKSLPKAKKIYSLPYLLTWKENTTLYPSISGTWPPVKSASKKHNRFLFFTIPIKLKYFFCQLAEILGRSGLGSRWCSVSSPVWGASPVSPSLPQTA